MKSTLPRTLSICSVIPASAGGWFLWKFNVCRQLAADPAAQKIEQTIYSTRAQIHLVSAAALLTIAALSLVIAVWINKRQRRKVSLKEPAAAD